MLRPRRFMQLEPCGPSFCRQPCSILRRPPRPQQRGVPREVRSHVSHAVHSPPPSTLCVSKVPPELVDEEHHLPHGGGGWNLPCARSPRCRCGWAPGGASYLHRHHPCLHLCGPVGGHLLGLRPCQNCHWDDGLHHHHGFRPSRGDARAPCYLAVGHRPLRRHGEDRGASHPRPHGFVEWASVAGDDHQSRRAYASHLQPWAVPALDCASCRLHHGCHGCRGSRGASFECLVLGRHGRHGRHGRCAPGAWRLPCAVGLPSAAVPRSRVRAAGASLQHGHDARPLPYELPPRPGVSPPFRVASALGAPVVPALRAPLEDVSLARPPPAGRAPDGRPLPSFVAHTEFGHVRSC
mmetsp:Transcript_60611/g.74299  ORF Transcript_60611/g.74299 Transcript_60611/m.74299 type:complete len:351 (+) Transcript_60611:105-1157(+)